MPSTGFQAVILCGPGESLQPFNSKPEEFPKALIPIANRPMVWYPLEWCYRTGITNIMLITPAACATALDAALSQNPHLTGLPAPKPTLLAPEGLTLTTGTAEIFRLPQVQAAITGDFVVLPCDIVCELKGVDLLENWSIMQGGLSQNNEEDEKKGKRGGIGLWYETRDSVQEGGVGVKKEETDFLVTARSSQPLVYPTPGSLRPRIEEVMLAMPTASLKDRIEEDQGLELRHASLWKYGNMKMTTKSRDAHVYLFPYWTKEFMRRNESFESISEDVVGWWAKAGWQNGLMEKLQMNSCLGVRKRRPSRPKQDGPDGYIDIGQLSSTARDNSRKHPRPSPPAVAPPFASRVADAPTSPATLTPQVPPLLAYLHPGQPTASLLRRVDTVPLLLSVSLFLARLPSLGETGSSESPFPHDSKIHPSSAPAPELRLTLDQATVLVDANVTFTSKSTIRESIIGAGCVLGTPVAASSEQTAVEAAKNAPPGVRLQRSLLMDGVVIESGSVLNGCVLGRRCRVGKGCDLRDCNVQDGYAVADGTTAKGEVFAGFDDADDEAGEMFADEDDGSMELDEQG